MKRAMTGKGRRGSPPLPRQRRALRVVQLTLAAMAAVAVRLAWVLWQAGTPGGRGEAVEVIVLGAIAVGCVSLAAWMGLATVRGPQPPSL